MNIFPESKGNFPLREGVLWFLLLTIPLVSVVLSFFANEIGPVMIGVAALVGGAVILLRPMLLLLGTVVMTMLICGPIVYNTPLDRIWWAAYVMAGMLYLPAIAALFNYKWSEDPGLRWAWPLIPLLLFSVSSSLINLIPATQWITVVKTYFLMTGIWVAFAVLPIPQPIIRKLLLLLLSIACVQWLFAAYQFVFVRSSLLASYGALASDAVVGSFGGGSEGGGQSAILALFLIIILTAVTAFQREKLLNHRRYAFMAVLIGFPLLLVEAKVVFFLLPAAFGIMYLDYIWKRPLVFISGIVLITLMLGTILIGLVVFHWEGGRYDQQSPIEKIESAFSYSFADKSGAVKQEEGILSRYEVLTYWFENHHLNDPVPLIIGHGIGSSRTGGLELGQVAKKHYPRNIDRTALSLGLWDIGILGVGFVLLLFFSAIRQAGIITACRSLPAWQCAMGRTLQAVFPLFLLAMLYRNDIPYAAPAWFLVMLAFGLLSWLSRSMMFEKKKYAQVVMS